MKIGIIGAGKVGCSIGKYLTTAEITVTGFYSKTTESAAEAAAFTKTKAYETIEDLVKTSDTLFLTTPDGVIKEAWDRIAGQDLHDKVICHFSGSLSSEIFCGINETGASGCSIHPMYAFCDKFTSYENFNTASLTIEGQTKALQLISDIFGYKLGHKIFILAPENKTKYHAAAVFASNYITGLIYTSVALLRECGFSDQDALELVRPLAADNIDAVFKNGPVQALTGPIERNDAETVAKHLLAINGSGFEDAYRALGNILISMAECRSPERDHSSLMKLMEADPQRSEESDLKKQISGKEKDENYSQHILQSKEGK